MKSSRLAVLACLVAVACTTTTFPFSAERAADVLRNYEAAFNTRDARAIAMLYAEEGLILPPGRPAVTGRNAIEKFWEGSVGGRLHLSATRVEVDRTLATIVGRYDFEGVSGGGKFVLVLRRDGADWKIVADTWNSDGD